MFVVAAFFVAGMSASFGFQFQALLYMLAVIYAPVNNMDEFYFVTGMYLPVILFSFLVRGVGKER